MEIWEGGIWTVLTNFHGRYRAHGNLGKGIWTVLTNFHGRYRAHGNLEKGWTRSGRDPDSAEQLLECATNLHDTSNGKQEAPRPWTDLPASYC